MFTICYDTRGESFNPLHRDALKHRSIKLLASLMLINPCWIAGCGPKIDNVATSGAGVSQQDEDPDAYAKEQDALMKKNR